MCNPKVKRLKQAQKSHYELSKMTVLTYFSQFQPIFYKYQTDLPKSDRLRQPNSWLQSQLYPTVGKFRIVLANQDLCIHTT